MLKGPEIPKDCKVIDGKYAAGLQTQILYERYELYKSLLPPLAGRQAQSFKCDKQRGTIFYYEYASQANRVEAEGGIRRLLWGEDHSTPEHPDGLEDNRTYDVLRRPRQNALKARFGVTTAF